MRDARLPDAIAPDAFTHSVYARGRHSPCINVCQLDAATDWCRGCGRRGDELMDWNARTPAEQAHIWHQLPARLEQLGVSVAMMPWSPSGVLDWLEDVLSGALGPGVFQLGDGAAAGRFNVGPDRPLAIGARTADTLLAHDGRGGVRIAAMSAIRVLAHGAPTDPDAFSLILPRVAAVRERCDTRGQSHHTRWDDHARADAGSLDPHERQIPLWALPAGTPTTRLMLRTSSGISDRRLAPVGGGAFAGMRITETAIGRLERPVIW